MRGYSKLVIFAILILAGTAGAQLVSNEIGMFIDPYADPASVSVSVPPNVPFTAYLIVFDPVNEHYRCGAVCEDPVRRPIDWISGFEYRLTKPASGLVTLEATPSGTVKVSASSGDNVEVGLVDPIPVSDRRTAILMTYKFMVTDSDPKFFFIGPETEAGESQMAIYDADEEPWAPSSQDVYPTSGANDRPIFALNGQVVATEQETWSGVKALYR